MKRVLITASALFISVLYADAQTTKAKLGIRAGANLSNVIKSGDSDFSTGSKTGFNAAFFADLPLASVFSIQPELQYSQKGFKSTGSFLGAPYEYKQTTAFIEVPVLAKIKPSKNFAILAGPQFSFLTSTTTSFSVNNSSYEDKVKEENDNLRKNILGGVLGLEASSKNFLVGLRYNLDFQANNGDGTSTTLKYKNQVTSFYIGVTF
jgi:hypothetical protein